MSDPGSRKEYEALAIKNTVYTGRGLNTAIEACCPFCAAPGFVAFKVIESRAAMAAENVCSACGRGAKTVFNENPANNETSFEIVQTRGPAPPAYLPPMRRVENGT